MNIKEVKDLINEILQSDITEFELEQTGTRVKLKRGYGQEITAAHAISKVSFETPSPQPVSPGTILPPAAPEESEEDNLHIVTSPIVGTFYRAPSPGADPYVKVGDQVEEGTILCVVEAMKLMNEIPSDVAGEVTRIYVENSHPVEFAQRLFGIRPRK